VPPSRFEIMYPCQYEFEFRVDRRRPGSYPQTGIMSGLATNGPELEIGVDEYIGLVSSIEGVQRPICCC